MKGSTRNGLVAWVGIALIGALTAGGSPGRAQQANAKAGRGQANLISVLEVRVPVTVTSENRFVGGLTAHNFEVYEDGRRQRIERFIPPTNSSRRIGILMYRNRPFEQDAGEDFADSMRNEQLDVELYQGFTNRDKRLYDDICRVIEERLSKGPDSTGSRILIVLTDGEGSAGSRSLEDAIETARRHNVSVFVISNVISDQNRSRPWIVAFAADEGSRINGQNRRADELAVEQRLRRLCEMTGGQFFRFSDKLDLFRAITRLEKPLRPEYVIYYVPQNQTKTGVSRSIEVKLVEAEGRLYHKKGYVY